MKTKTLISIVLLNALFDKAYAAHGNASDGLEASLVLIGFLLIVTGLLYVTDYLKKNGNKMIRKVFVFSKRIIKAIITMINEARSKFYHPIYLSFWKI